MKKTLIFILIGVIFGVAAFFVWQEAHAPVTLNQALYPLYTGVSWGPVKTSTVDGAVGAEIQSEPIDNLTNIEASSTPFMEYYKDKLLAAGWVQDMSREAGGPGAEVSVYTKGSQFVVVSFTSEFKNKPKDAPEQCPCDLTFTLVSGTAK